MESIWTAVSAISAALTMLTMLFLYIVRSEISRAVGKVDSDWYTKLVEREKEYSIRFATKEELSVISRSLHRVAEKCPVTCGLAKEFKDVK
jgi:hypothetical protein